MRCSTFLLSLVCDADDVLDGLSRFCTLGTALFGLLTYVTSTNFVFALMLNLLVAISSVCLTSLETWLDELG